MPTTEEYIAACVAAQAKADPTYNDQPEAERFVRYYQACRALEPPPADGAAPAAKSAMVLVEITAQTDEEAQKLDALKADSLAAVQAAVCPAGVGSPGASQ